MYVEENSVQYGYGINTISEIGQKGKGKQHRAKSSRLVLFKRIERSESRCYVLKMAVVEPLTSTDCVSRVRTLVCFH
jgi:hypothetical protein